MERYTKNDVQNDLFYQMPKFLFEDEFKQLSNDARVLYSLLKDRHKLSIENNWVNENDEVFLIYTRNEMSDMLGLSNKTVLKAVNQLNNLCLIEEVRQGINKPNLIYLSYKALETLGRVNSTLQDMEILHGNKTDINNTDTLNVVKTKKNRYKNPKRKPTKNNKSEYKDFALEAAASLADNQIKNNVI